MLANVVKENNIFRQGKKKERQKKPTLFSHWFECLHTEKKVTIFRLFIE